ncbi:methanethiol S-methyltransferase [Catellatospora citrea]|uniref:methanethiol S-methyltransferase n=1 Tax=Catellatospora citrea TaxID=53366 RepID=A0A8J3NYK9_9ACTN|nr:methanethiol S-methyltransferase [Catellatospora citrea]RKE05837.1 protein-S-isoprenylcysteine O-methyltransferase Ste14 [Catellatospora citrea]GIF97198.1 membrane protein [Catellatospora citrea]
MIRRILALGYGGLAYAAFLAAITYTIGFLANAVVPKGVDDGATGPVWLAVAVDAGLLGVFAVQHSVMARPWFKRWWTRFVPAAVERSTFVLLSSLAVGLLLWQWRPLTAEVWSVETPWLRVVLWTVCGLGWGVLVLSTFLIGHFDLFGLRQVLARARESGYAEPGFRQPMLYRIVRHPIMVGFIIAFWATPDMSAGHLLFAAAATGYILIAVRFEEHDLRKALGEPYEQYARQVPRFIPRVRPVSERVEA